MGRSLKAYRPALAALVLAVLLAAVVAPRAEAAFFFESKWGEQGIGDGQFDGPEGIGTSPSGSVYVADTANDRIQHFDAAGAFIGKWGGFGVIPGRFNRPVGVATDSGGNVYVADNGNGRIQKFSPTGVLMAVIGQAGTATGRFNEPSGVAVDATGNLFVADTGNHRIQKFGPSGSFITAWGTGGAGNGQFNQPIGIALDFTGNVYVTDAANYRVQKFDSNGAFLTKWGTQGSGNGQFNPPYGIAVSSSEGAVYVADSGGHRVEQFGPTGTFMFASGVLGSADGQFRFPAGVAVDAADRVYVADTANHRVQRFFTSGAAIVAVKDSVPDDAQDFSFTAGGGLSPASFVLDDDGNPSNGTSNSRTFAADPGSGYSLAESTPAGWDLDSATCSDGSDPANIDVSTDEVVTCTFTNHRRGRIVVVQDSTPNDPQDFAFTVGGGSSPSSFQLDDDGDSTLSNTQVIVDVVPGSGHSVSQITPAGWGAADTSCSDGSPVSNIDVAPGETVTCTFVNLSETAGRLVVVKDTDPNDPQDFVFTAAPGLSPSSFALDDDGSNTNGVSNTREFIVTPQSGYSVSETTLAGWHLSSATCSDGSPISNIDVGPSETVTCTFVNRKSGTIRVVKDASPNDPQDFDFTAVGGLSPTTFQLDDDGSESNGLASIRTFASVAPGSGYSIAESVPLGWEQTSATCSDGSPVTNIDVAPGEIVTCTFSNFRQAGILVVKDAQPDDPQDFDFTAGGGLSPSSFQLDDDGDDNNGLARSRLFDSLSPGSGYSVSEDAGPGWDSTATCSDGSPPSNIDLSPSELVTCTFTNRRHGSITLDLDTRPDGPQDFDFTTAGGLSPSSFQLDDDGDNGNELSNTVSFPDVSAGQYSIDQTPVSGWVQEEGDCSDGSPVSDIDLAPGEHVTCTIAMSTRAKIVVVKDARPNDQQDFDFTAGGGISPSSFQLDDDAIETNALPSRRTFIVDPGSGYSVQEPAVPTAWRLDSATCSDGSPTTSIGVVAGETVTCTFVNVGDAYPRPKGASPIRVSLVPAYNPCAAPNRTHGPPLAFPSCNPPVQFSTNLTVGSPDANGAAANSMGSVKLKVLRTPGGPDDSDVEITGTITDVRCRAGTMACGAANAADGADYSGMLRVVLDLRITDRGAGDVPATVQNFDFLVDIPCAVSGSTSIGSACVVNTSADAIVPGAVPEGQRSIWEVGQVAVWDGGPDGVPATPGADTVFMRQGVFAP